MRGIERVSGGGLEKERKKLSCVTLCLEWQAGSRLRIFEMQQPVRETYVNLEESSR